MIVLPKIFVAAGIILALANNIAGVRQGEDADIDPTAIIDPTVSWGDEVRVKANVKIEKKCSLGDSAWVFENVIIKQGSSLGDSASVGKNSQIGKSVSVGDRAIISPNVIIDDKVKIEPKSQILDNVIISKSTIIGEESMVDSGTKIGAGVSLGDHVYVGKNLKIGNGVKIATNATVFTNLPDGTNINRNQVIISALTSESLLKVLDGYKYDEIKMRKVMLISDDRYVDYMLACILDVLRIIESDCYSNVRCITHQPRDFDAFKFLIAAYFRRRMKIDARQLQQYIDGGAEKYPELNNTHFGHFDRTQGQKKISIIKAFRKAWVMLLDDSLRPDFRGFRIVEYCDSVSGVWSGELPIKMYGDDKTPFVF